MRKAAAFYWTLPVPWAGFTALSSDIDEAARQSRTIAFQRELLRRWASEHGFTIDREDAFVELEPDRGSAQILDPLNALLGWARAHDATLLYADFGELVKWRSHMVLDRWLHGLRQENVRHMAVGLQSVPLDGQPFDPASHFAAWRDRQAAWRAGKEGRKAAARQKAQDMSAQGLRAKAITTALNAQGLRTATGKPWTDENVRKLLK